MSSPTSRSLAALKADGWHCAVVEKFVRFPPPGHRVDAFGFIDILCFRSDEVLAVQATSGSKVSARISKIRLIPAADFWLQSPTRRLFVQGWAKRGKRGERKTWSCRTIEVTPTGTLEL